MENWLPVVGADGRYEVSDLGRVRSWVAGKLEGVSQTTVWRIASGKAWT